MSNTLKSDFLIINSEGDLHRAIKLCKLLESFGYCGSVFDIRQRCLEQCLNDVRHVLVCVSNSLGDSSFCTIQQVVTQRYLATRTIYTSKCNANWFRINPVHLHENIVVDDNTRSRFLGLMQFTNFYLHYKSFEKDIRKEFEKYRTNG